MGSQRFLWARQSTAKKSGWREAKPLYVLNVIHEGAIRILTPIAHRFSNTTAGDYLFGASIPDRPSTQNLMKKIVNR